jgi:hypoxanthine phosphoribosyltransferase
VSEPTLGEMLFDERTIAARVAELGAAISKDYTGKLPMVVGVLAAAAVFLADLTRAIEIPADFDLIGVTKYSNDEGIRFEKDTAHSVEGRHVIVVEDTIDTGMTLHYVMKTLGARHPASLAVCTLLDRPKRRLADIQVAYRGFEIPDVYAVGYGLDYRGRYRELPALYAHGTWPD